MDTTHSAALTPHILRPSHRAEHIDLGSDWDPPVLSPTATARELGAWGEEIACRHLSARGICVLSRNWRCRSGEIDLVCHDPARQSIIACEVKTRRERGSVPAIESVSRTKLARLRRLLGIWVSTHNQRAEQLDIDVIAITVGDEDLWNLCHIEGVA
ncbi:MAG: YraN family protein [Ancrocorticia sp.]|uniref:YraN family protein n=1 Tax=Ancrocorticia sp. TaxID=2593684 RepID=UPI003F9080DA